MPNVIEIEGLRKVYRRWRRPPVAAVAGLDLAVPEGGVFGFLGPNGSGKTSTIRCLLGLIHPSAGRLALFGQPVPSSLDRTMRSVGAVVETPSLFPTMSARENLMLLAGIDRIPARRADEILELVGLAERADQTVRRYSLGMRQRLGLAAALLKDPALLILDEPANGLDPAGIRDTRRLLRRLGDEGRTVFLSSHLLAEIEHTCDAVAILNAGRCLLTGGVREVLAASQPATVIVQVEGGHSDDAWAVLSQAGFSADRQNGHVRVAIDPQRSADVTKTLAAGGLWVSHLKQEEASLEDFFLELTANAPAESVSEPELVEMES